MHNCEREDPPRAAAPRGLRLARRLVTAEFSRQSASEMIDALAVAMDATVARARRVITLRPR